MAPFGVESVLASAPSTRPMSSWLPSVTRWFSSLAMKSLESACLWCNRAPHQPAPAIGADRRGRLAGTTNAFGALAAVVDPAAGARKQGPASASARLGTGTNLGVREWLQVMGPPHSPRECCRSMCSTDLFFASRIRWKPPPASATPICWCRPLCWALLSNVLLGAPCLPVFGPATAPADPAAAVPQSARA